MERAGHEYNTPGEQRQESARENRQPKLVARHGRDRTRTEWASGIRAAVLGRLGYSTNTGGGKEVARLSELGWYTET